MSWHDRNRRGNFQRAIPAVTNLIILNIFCYLLQLVLNGNNSLLPGFDFTNWGKLHYFTQENFKPHQLITSAFLHSEFTFAHIIFNMIGLYVFGSMLEKAWGSKDFLVFYVICAVGASLLYLAALHFTEDPDFLKNQFAGALGASGAVYGCMAAAALLFPNTEMISFIGFFPIPMKLKFLVLFYIVIGVFGAFNKYSNDNIAHFAHIGGALVGFIYVVLRNKLKKDMY